MDKALEQQVTEARAKIIWGEAPEQVRIYLQESGLDADQADRVLQICLAERGREVRRLGLRDLVIGICCSLVGAGFIFLHLWMFPGLMTRVMGLFLTLALFGIWKWIKGLDLLLSGAKTSGSVSKM